MARVLIHEAHGGATREIDDRALPYFQGWVILDTLDDSTDASPLYLSKAESDFRYVRAGQSGALVSQMTATAQTPIADINAWLASPAAVKRLLGTVVTAAPLIIPSNTYLDATGATITLTSFGNLMQNSAVQATGARDSNITIVGGTWDRGSQGGSGTQLHTMMFRRVDGLRITDATLKGTAGKYAINLGDVTKFEVGRITFAVASDGVHINGPASLGRIHTIRGTTGDDSVALTGNDYTAYADVSGSITDVAITDVDATSTHANLIKALAGQGCTISDIAIGKVRGTAAQAGVWLGDDNGQASTLNGTHGTLQVRDVDGTFTQGAVLTNFTQGADMVEIDGATLRNATATFGVVSIGIGATGTIQSLIVRGVRCADAAVGIRLLNINAATGARIAYLRAQDFRARNVSGSSIAVYFGPVTVDRWEFLNPNLSASDTSTTNWLHVTSSAVLGPGTVNGGRISGGKGVLLALAAFTVTFGGGLLVTGVNRMSNQSNAALTVYLGELTVTSPLNQLFYADATATALSVFVGNANLPASPVLVQRAAGTTTMRVAGTNASADITILTPQAGDMVKNSNAGATTGAGLSVYTGTVWKNLTV